MVSYIFVCGLVTWSTHMFSSLFEGGSHRSARPGLFPLVSPLKYRLSCAALQKHLNLRWQECVQLISSTVAPSSGFLLHNTWNHRKIQTNTRKHNTPYRGAVPVCPVHCHNLFWSAAGLIQGSASTLNICFLICAEPSLLHSNRIFFDFFL